MNYNLLIVMMLSVAVTASPQYSGVNTYSVPNLGVPAPPNYQQSSDLSSGSFALGGRDTSKPTYRIPDGDEEVHKHIFAYVAADERPAPPIKIDHSIKKEKHYKIIFIKAPGVEHPQIDIGKLPAPPQVQTIVYVLQPKPGKIVPPTIDLEATKKPAIPQVFFVKYDKNRGANYGLPTYTQPSGEAVTSRTEKSFF